MPSMTEMRGLYLDSDGLRLRADLPMPVAGSGEALIRVRLAGICGTDLAMLGGYAGFGGVPGHEFVGEVVTTADAAWAGRRVVGSINIGCGRCDACRSDGPAHCVQRQVLGIRGRDGAFAEYLRLPVANLHGVPDQVSDRLMSLGHKKLLPKESLAELALIESRTHALIDQNTGESYFKARVEVDRSSLEELDDSIELSPGMPAEVMIMTGERTALEYILRPFLETFRRAFRED